MRYFQFIYVHAGFSQLANSENKIMGLHCPPSLRTYVVSGLRFYIPESRSSQGTAAGLGRLHAQCNRLRLRLPLDSVITITIMIIQFSKGIEYDYDYMTKVFDYNYDYNETGLRLIIS